MNDLRDMLMPMPFSFSRPVYPVLAYCGVLIPVGAQTATPTTVGITNFSLVPTPVNLALGSQLTWTNTDDATHTVVSDDGKFKSLNLPTNAKFSVSRQAAGTYTYHFSIHPRMKGSVAME